MSETDFVSGHVYIGAEDVGKGTVRAGRGSLCAPCCWREEIAGGESKTECGERQHG